MGLSRKQYRINVIKYTKNKTQKNYHGGAYKAPLRPADFILDDKHSIQYICAHGEISPEIFYVVPKGVYVLLPNVCGVATSVTHTISDPIYQNKDDADSIFRKKFITGELSDKGAQFTVFTPGDIMPMQTFIFSPFVGRIKKNKTMFGFVGVFEPSILNDNPLYTSIKTLRIYDNIFQLNDAQLRKLLWDVMNYLKNGFGTKPTGPIYGLYRECLRRLINTSVKTEDLLKYDVRIIISHPEISVLPEFYRQKLIIYNDVLDKIPINLVIYCLNILIHTIPENNLANLISKKYLESVKSNSKQPLFSIKTLVDNAKIEEGNTYFVVNACRSLMERKGGIGFNLEHNEEIPGSAAATMTAMATAVYSRPNSSKYSAEIISKIDAFALNADGDPTTALNMNNINAVRKANGLDTIRKDVFHYSELREIFRETVTRSLADPGPYSVLIERLKEVVGKLENYRPIEEVRATSRIKEEVAIASDAAAAASLANTATATTERRAELDREIETVKRQIAKLKLNVKFNKTGAKKKELEEKQGILRQLKEKIDS